jgi:hypothetical protein
MKIANNQIVMSEYYWDSFHLLLMNHAVAVFR